MKSALSRVEISDFEARPEVEAPPGVAIYNLYGFVSDSGFGFARPVFERDGVKYEQVSDDYDTIEYFVQFDGGGVSIIHEEVGRKYIGLVGGAALYVFINESSVVWCGRRFNARKALKNLADEDVDFLLKYELAVFAGKPLESCEFKDDAFPFPELLGGLEAQYRLIRKEDWYRPKAWQFRSYTGEREEYLYLACSLLNPSDEALLVRDVLVFVQRCWAKWDDVGDAANQSIREIFGVIGRLDDAIAANRSPDSLEVISKAREFACYVYALKVIRKYYVKNRQKVRGRQRVGFWEAVRADDLIRSMKIYLDARPSDRMRWLAATLASFSFGEIDQLQSGALVVGRVVEVKPTQALLLETHGLTFEVPRGLVTVDDYSLISAGEGQSLVGQYRVFAKLLKEVDGHGATCRGPQYLQDAFELFFPVSTDTENETRFILGGSGSFLAVLTSSKKKTRLLAGTNVNDHLVSIRDCLGLRRIVVIEFRDYIKSWQASLVKHFINDVFGSIRIAGLEGGEWPPNRLVFHVPRSQRFALAGRKYDHDFIKIRTTISMFNKLCKAFGFDLNPKWLLEWGKINKKIQYIDWEEYKIITSGVVGLDLADDSDGLDGQNPKVIYAWS
ncbi:hypothetical protein [Rhodopseudomonas sp.]|uniref:hypothetical protein n=1 Tax=Rhodopseudomonas sp. TaxID=1078 RepID=UPI003B3A85DE